MSNAKARPTRKSRLWTTASNVKSNPKFILRHAQDDGLEMLKNEIMVRPRRELSRTLVEPLILDFEIHLVFACLPCLPQAGAGRDFEIWILRFFL
jgi:hypothetical protein